MRMFIGWLVWMALGCWQAFGCSCLVAGCPGLGSPQGPVFIGTVLEVTELPWTDKYEHLMQRKVKLRVVESFGGLGEDQAEVTLYTGLGGGDCGVDFHKGETFLVDAQTGKDKLMHASICSFTRRMAEAGTVLRFLRDRKANRPIPTLAGQIVQVTRNFEDRNGYLRKPLPNKLVRIRSEGSSYETLADSEGIFAFYNLPRGSYDYDPDQPAGGVYTGWLDSEDRPAPMKLPGFGCERRDIEIYASGSIQGRVWDSSGELVTNASLSILLASSTAKMGDRSLYWVFPDEKTGYFKFIHLPPGEYLVVINPEDEQRPSFPYKRTFYPGVYERSEAKVIAVRDGEEVRDVDIRLKRAFEPRTVMVRVTWADGTSVPDYTSIKAKGTVNKQLESSAMTDSKKPAASLALLPDEAYEVEAELICRYSDDRSSGPGAYLHSSKIFVKPADGVKEITLSFAERGCPVIPGKRLEN